MPPVPPPDRVIVGDADVISLSTFPNIKLSVWVYVSPLVVNPLKVTTPAPFADYVENFLCAVYDKSAIDVGRVLGRIKKPDLL